MSQHSLSARLLYTLCITLLFTACRKEAGDGTQGGYIVSRFRSASTQGNILLAPYNTGSQYNPGSVMIMDGAGNALGQVATPAAALNFRKWTIHNQTRYTWFVYDAALSNPQTGGYQQGYAVIADENLKEMRQVRLLPSGSLTDVSQQSLDGHDFLLLDDDRYIAMAYVIRHVRNVPANLSADGTAYVAAPVIQEVQNMLVKGKDPAQAVADAQKTMVAVFKRLGQPT